MMVTAEVLTSHGYEVVQTTSPNGCLAKLDYESPDVLLIDTAMPRLAVDDLLNSIGTSGDHTDLIVVLFSNTPSAALNQTCLDKDLPGYFSKGMDVTRLPEYIDYFF